jgi:hypothetical protein
MGRPKIIAKRDRQLNFSLTSDELTTLHRRAEAAGQRLADYGRNQLMQYRLMPSENAPKPVDRQLLNHLMRIGNNLNQMARFFNMHPKENAPRDLVPTLQELRAILNKGLNHDPPHP